MKAVNPLPLCREVQRIDDRLGQRSDHEGCEEGPTYILWSEGKEFFDDVCAERIESHREAIRIWKRLQRLNQKR